jgi:hypothetical protein
VDADTQVPAGQRSDRKRVVNLGGGDVIDAERLDLREREIPRQRERFEVSKCRTAREMLEQEAVQVVIMR